MRFLRFGTTLLSVAALLSSTAQALDIVLSNDDGWAELNIRELYNALTAENHSVVISAPAYDNSGKGSKDKPPTYLRAPGEFNSLPFGAPPTGFNQSQPRFNYVNSYPATSMKHGIDVVAPKFFDGNKPDLAVAGVNVGRNMGIGDTFSGTYGCALMADSMGVPAIAFSAGTGDQISWETTPVPMYVQLYSDLAVKIIDTLVANEQPWMNPGTFIAVNFPRVGSECPHWGAVENPQCTKVEDFKFILTSANSWGRWFPKDVFTCGAKTLPNDVWIMDTLMRKEDGCYVTITVMNRSRFNADPPEQSTVKENLRSILSCLPDSKGPL